MSELTSVGDELSLAAVCVLLMELDFQGALNQSATIDIHELHTRCRLLLQTLYFLDDTRFRSHLDTFFKAKPNLN